MKKIKYLLALFFIFSFIDVGAKILTQKEYEAYGIKRSYVVCDYIFDISKHNPTLKDFLLSSQSCPTDKVSILEIKMSQDINGNTTRTYQDLLTGTKYGSFPSVNARYIYSSSIGSNEKKNTIDTLESVVSHNITTKTVTSDIYDKYNLKRTYIVGPYIFDLSKHNPTLRDLMLASQYNKKGVVSIVEAKTSTNLEGTTTKTYQELLGGVKLTTFPQFEGRYIMGSMINPSDHNKETRVDIISGETINNGLPDEEIIIKDDNDPRKKAVNYSTSCMGSLTIPKVKDVVNGVCIRWKDKSMNKKAQSNDVNTGLYTLPVSNYPNVVNGNLVIAAHSGTASISYFKTLYKLSVGDKAIVKFNGNNYTYVIKNIYYVPKTGVVKITRNSNRTTLTLITCTKNDESKQTVYILELHDIDGVEYQ
jgi:LPXTG-site transpeptidase (sortase) family protein